MPVDLNDFKRFETTRHGKPVRQKLYRHTCNTCGADKGYQAKSSNTKTCNKCSHKGMKFSEEHRAKQSAAAMKRYNDPTWPPKEKPAPFVGLRRPLSSYKQKTSAIQRKMRHNMKSLLWQKLVNHSTNKNGHTFDLLGYGVDDLIKHLELKFQPGMSWDNYGENGWEIDHIIPDSSFTYSSTIDQGFKDSWALTNLQPLWYWDNRSKGDKLCLKR
jgi:hypothetical protein